MSPKCVAAAWTSDSTKVGKLTAEGLDVPLAELLAGVSVIGVA